MVRCGEDSDVMFDRLARPQRVATCLGACLLLAACGTDVAWLLERDSVLVAEADKVATRAEAVDPDLTTAMYDAEDVKRAACQTIYGSISEMMQRPPTYGEELVSDLGLFLAYFIPFDEIESCAEAQAAYAAAVDDLNRTAPETGAPAGN